MSQPVEQSKNNDIELLLLVAKAIIGTVLLCVGFANIYNLIEWAQQYNQILVYFLFFLYMSVAGMLFWGGFKGLWQKLRS